MGCTVADTATAGDFHSHIYDLREEIANHIANQIEGAVYHAADDIQQTIDDGEELTEEQKKEIEVWQKNLSIDLTTIDAAREFGGGGTKADVKGAVRRALERLTERASMLPNPDLARELVSTIKTKLAGEGFHQEGGKARGLLGDVSDEAHYLRTDLLADWSAPTAEDFKVKVLEKAQGVADKQHDEVNTLIHLADCNYAAIRQARRDLDSIAHAGDIAAYNMAETCGEGTDGEADGVAATLGMIAGGLTLAGALTSGNIAVTLSAASGLATFFQSSLNDKPELSERSFAAANWKELVEKIAAATQEVEDSLDSVYDAIRAAAKNSRDELEKDFEKHYVVKPVS